MELSRERGPRERALDEGMDRLADADLVAILLGTGVPGRSASLVATELVDSVGGVARLSRASPARMSERQGVGAAKALRVAAAFELGRRAAQEEAIARRRVSTADEVAALMHPRLDHLDHEEMWLLSLDGQNGTRAVRRVAQGGLHGCSVTARDILRVALGDAASAIVLVHNHPSGDPKPSAEDIAMTRVVAEAAEIVGVALVDHVVVSGGGHVSLLELGVL
jgi:DNA repair protein RadC